MAQLENVRIIADKIEVDGVIYVKTDKDAEVGDIIRFKDEEYPSWITFNGFYTVRGFDDHGDPYVKGNDAEEYDLWAKEYDVYTKESTEDSSPQYREVKRKARLGERIKITEAHDTFDGYKNGDIFTVEYANYLGGVYVGNSIVHICHEEYVVLETITETETQRLQVGDYVRITKNENGAPIGAIVKVTGLYGTGRIFYDYGFRNFTATHENCYEKVPKEDADQFLKDEDERQKWAEIGREVDEYKAGDIFSTPYNGINEVKYIDNCVSHLVRFKSDLSDDDGMLPKGCTLVCPVEQRFDRK